VGGEVGGLKAPRSRRERLESFGKYGLGGKYARSVGKIVRGEESGCGLLCCGRIHTSVYPRTQIVNRIVSPD